MEVVDRISCLPDEIILHILSFLTMFDVVPTSALSKRWKFLWTFVPNMNFPRYYDLFLQKPNYNITAIDRCIKQCQSKQLHTLSISLNVYKDASKQVQEWFEFAVDRKVQYLHINACTDCIKPEEHRKLSKVPNSLFLLQSLQHLILSNVEFYPFLEIKCFDSLNYLSLSYVKISDGALHSLLSKCYRLQTLFLSISPGPRNMHISLPHLEHLRIVSDSNCETLQIYAPNLLRFEVRGHFMGKLYMANADRLREVVFYFQGNQMAQNNLWGPTMHTIANIEVLKLRFDVLVLICTEIYKNGGRVELDNLKELHLDSYRSTAFPLHFLLSLLRDCPSIVTLDISVFFSERKLLSKQLEDDMKLTSDFGVCYFDNLRHVEFKFFSGDPDQKTLLKFLFRKAKILEDVHLQLGQMSKDHEEHLTKYLFKLPKASQCVSIMVRSYNSSRSYKVDGVDSHWLMNYRGSWLVGICSYIFSRSTWMFTSVNNHFSSL